MFLKFSCLSKRGRSHNPMPVHTIHSQVQFSLLPLIYFNHYHDDFKHSITGAFSIPAILGIPIKFRFHTDFIFHNISNITYTTDAVPRTRIILRFIFGSKIMKICGEFQHKNGFTKIFFTLSYPESNYYL